MAIKLKPIHAAILTLEDGLQIHVERIGQGRYSTAWKNGTAVYAQTHEKDYGKELMCHLSGRPHLPVIESLESFNDSSVYNWYKMPVYAKLTAKHKSAWADFRHLQRLQKDAWASERAAMGWQNVIPANVNDKFAELVESTPGLAQRYGESIRSLETWCATYGQSWLIENLQVRNCMVDGNGELILLDPVFDLAEVQAEQEKRMKKAREY